MNVTTPKKSDFEKWLLAGNAKDRFAAKKIFCMFNEIVKKVKNSI